MNNEFVEILLVNNASCFCNLNRGISYALFGVLGSLPIESFGVAEETDMINYITTM